MFGTNTPTVTIDHGRLCLANGLELSFQRFKLPETGAFEHLPASLGALPVGSGVQDDFVLPLAVDEAFWIGLSLTSSATPVWVGVEAELQDGRVLDVLSSQAWSPESHTVVTVPGVPRIGGFPRPDGCKDAFFRASARTGTWGCVCLRIHASRKLPPVAEPPLNVTLRLLDYAGFSAETGLPPPDKLDVQSGYRGWRLP